MYVCFIFHDRQRVFEHTYMLKSVLKHDFWIKNARNLHRERVLSSHQRKLCCRWNAKTLTGRGVLKRATYLNLMKMQRGFGNIHTYIRSWRLPGKVKNARNPHRERGLGSDQRELCCRWNAKTLTGRGVSKRTRKESSWLLSMYVCMFGKRELCCRWNAKTLTGRGVSKRT